MALEAAGGVRDRSDRRLPRLRPQDPAQREQPARAQAGALEPQRLDVEGDTVERGPGGGAEREHRPRAAHIQCRLHEPGQVPGDDADAACLERVDEEPERRGVDDIVVLRSLAVST